MPASQHQHQHQHQHYDLIVVGSSFASSFFLHKFLQQNPAAGSVLVLEKGPYQSHQQQLTQYQSLLKADNPQIINHNPQHHWVSHSLFGGNSNGWWACTPRMMPNDFRLQQQYGQGVDWPLSYDELEPYYCEAEQLLSVSGASPAPYPMSCDYPQAAHNMNQTDKVLQKHFPGQYFALPTARRRTAINDRPACCANGVCTTCPIDAKFTILNSMADLYNNDNVELLNQCEVTSLQAENNQIKKLQYKDVQGFEHTVSANYIALGANAVFNTQILLRSNLTHPSLGHYLNEQASITVDVLLDGLDNFQGSTSLTGHGYMFYDGEHRKQRAACLIENSNLYQPSLRTEKNRWQQAMQFKCIVEDIPQHKNKITLAADPTKVEVHYQGHSSYAEQGLNFMKQQGIKQLLDALPVESYKLRGLNKTESHIMGTHRMGSDSTNSVVDDKLVHHQYRNLFMLGSGTFPSSAPANPTLTLCALSLRAADSLTAEGY